VAGRLSLPFDASGPFGSSPGTAELTLKEAALTWGRHNLRLTSPDKALLTISVEPQGYEYHDATAELPISIPLN
jgi:hypothetical protein